MQGALNSSSTLVQLRAFAKIKSPDIQDDRDLDWQVLYLALRCGHFDEAIKVYDSIELTSTAGNSSILA